MRLKNISKNNRGQAMIETLLSTVFLTIVVFAGIQLVIMVVNDLIANEAAFAISRVAVVSKTDKDVKAKTLASALFLFMNEISSGKLDFVPYNVPVDYVTLEGAHINERTNRPKEIKSYNTRLKYLQSIMFGKLLSGSTILSIGNTNVKRNTSRAWMVKSPDEDYYDKSYPSEVPGF
ncbi:MAG: hypothetical protein NT145_02810 [Elusimicrobia bacterium]|nr:hypothetical protein [Elusimicrobiota bacterium]